MYEQVLRRNTSASPNLIAHRGFAVRAPQNSLPAFQAAGELGFWAIETDVRKTADGVLVCCHNATVDAMYEGSGAVASMDWEALRRLRFRTERSRGCAHPGAMPTFREYLSVCKEYGSIPFIETKTDDIADVLEAAGEFFREDEFIISSIDFSHLQSVREVSGRVFIHHIFSSLEKMRQLSQMGPAGLSYNCPDWHDCPPNLLEETHRSGVRVCLRAGDTAQAVSDMIRLGLDYIPTNCVSAL